MPVYLPCPVEACLQPKNKSPISILTRLLVLIDVYAVENLRVVDLPFTLQSLNCAAISSAAGSRWLQISSMGSGSTPNPLDRPAD